MTGTPRRVRRTADAARSEILAAALRRFSRFGYRGTTIAGIAADVGISDVGVLYHFATKAALFQAVVDHFSELQLDRFTAMVKPGGLAALRLLGGWGGVMQERPDLLALQVVLSAEGVDPESELHEYFVTRYRYLLDVLSGLIATAIADGDLRADLDVRSEARALVAYLDGLRLQWFYAPDDWSLDRAVSAHMANLTDRLATP